MTEHISETPTTAIDKKSRRAEKKAQKSAAKVEKSAAREEKRAALDERRDALQARLDAAKAESRERAEHRRLSRVHEVLDNWTLKGRELRVAGGGRHDIAGAVAEVAVGQQRKRMTVTRVVGGTVIAGPVGTIVGAVAKKDRSRCFVTVTLSGGTEFMTDLPAKQEPLARRFAAAVNTAAAHFDERDAT